MSGWFRKNVTGEGLFATFGVAALLAFFVVLILAVLSDQNHGNERKRQSELACIANHMTWVNESANCVNNGTPYYGGAS